jgi:hypothetical protein
MAPLPPFASWDWPYSSCCSLRAGHRARRAGSSLDILPCGPKRTTMPQATCSWCKRKLWIDDGSRSATLTCPSCLAKIKSSSLQTAISTAPATTPSVCPRCGNALQAGWKVCPHCQIDLRSMRRRKPGSSLDADVRCDNSATFLGIFVVALMLGVGIGIAMFGYMGRWQNPLLIAAVSTLGSAFFCTMVSVVFLIVRPNASGRVNELAFGCVLLVATPLALIILFFAVCAPWRAP